MTPPHLSTSGRGSARLRAAAAIAALTALPVLSLAAAPGAAHATALRAPALDTPRHDRQPQTVNVAMSNSGFTLPAQVNAGFVTFATTTADPTGHALQGFRLNAGVTQAKALQDLKQATSTTPSLSAAGITAATKDITAVGGATVDPATPVQVTIPLTAGTYYFLDFTQLFTPGHQVTLKTLQVTGAFDSDTPAHDQEIVQTTVNGKPRFTAPSTLNTAGTFLISNQADEIHEAVFQRVNPGVTDAAVQTFFNAVGQNQKPTSIPFAEQGMRGAGGISPGRTELLHFSPPAGSYSLECFVPDDKTGVPHAFLGMHQVVALSAVSGPVGAGRGGGVKAGDTRELALGAGLTGAALLAGLALLRRRAAAKV
ncbi:hypothetical protein EDD99_0259 [Streptomyces sp. 846.5]|nr:hypothetical protein [Streptomyces sp. 846.5]TDU01877.1 hypothetical protein EDD99_0259 [Streptomyces sp. 846.5]